MMKLKDVDLIEIIAKKQRHQRTLKKRGINGARKKRWNGVNATLRDIQEMLTNNETPTFIDLFAGCGGLSLGLMEAGWSGLFAVERSTDAFRTLKENLVEGKVDHQNPLAGTGRLFKWPEELGDPKAHSIEDFLEPGQGFDDYHQVKRYLETLGALGQVDLLAGGPPCQGFSTAGRRVEEDHRNKLYKRYIQFVKLLSPKLLLVENVKGISIPFRKKGTDKCPGKDNKPHSKVIEDELGKLNYITEWFPVESWKYGVPQLRPRYIMLGVLVKRGDSRFGCSEAEAESILKGFKELLYSDVTRHEYITKVLGLPPKCLEQGVSVQQAIGDLSEKHAGCEKYRPLDGDFTIEEYSKTPFKRYSQLGYNPKQTGRSNFQKLMRKGLKGKKANSRRVARHTDKTRGKFEIMLDMANKLGPDNKPILPRASSLSEAHREELKARLAEKNLLNGGLKKHAMVILDPDKPSNTLTTLPDDLLHYENPRILTVREYARLQSFPDWFDFKGKYTTGGHRRKVECPRYTQVGNAVPPLLSQYIGKCLIKLVSKSHI